MPDSRLHDDLFKDYKEQQRFMQAYVKLFDPVAESLSRPAATRLPGRFSLVMMEVCFYLLGLGTIAFAVFGHKWPPFSTMDKLLYDANIRASVGAEHLFILNFIIYALLGVIAMLFILLAQYVRTIRLKNTILKKATKNIKELAGQVLRRKAAVDAIEQRYFTELPTLGVNEIPNPGYDGN